MTENRYISSSLKNDYKVMFHNIKASLINNHDKLPLAYKIHENGIFDDNERITEYEFRSSRKIMFLILAGFVLFIAAGLITGSFAFLFWAFSFALIAGALTPADFSKLNIYTNSTKTDSKRAEKVNPDSTELLIRLIFVIIAAFFFILGTAFMKKDTDSSFWAISFLSFPALIYIAMLYSCLILPFIRLSHIKRRRKYCTDTVSVQQNTKNLRYEASIDALDHVVSSYAGGEAENDISAAERNIESIKEFLSAKEDVIYYPRYIYEFNGEKYGINHHLKDISEYSAVRIDPAHPKRYYREEDIAPVYQKIRRRLGGNICMGILLMLPLIGYIAVKIAISL